MRRALVLVIASACSTLDPSVGAVSPPVDGGAPVLFWRDIRPLMNRSASDPTGDGCIRCHYSTEASHIGLDASGLDLATLGALRRGGNDTHQNIIIPYDSADSAIIRKLYGTFPIGLRMPRYGPDYWSEEDIELFAQWIDQGAKGDDSE
jgi:hypothetical protein